MEHYVGPDVSLRLTTICIVDRTGKIEREGEIVPPRHSLRLDSRSGGGFSGSRFPELLGKFC